MSRLRTLAEAAAGWISPSSRSSADLLVVAFHAVVPRSEDIGLNVLDPFQPITLSDVERTVAILRRVGRRFVTSRMIAEGAPSESPCAWITFDDGYANNTTALRLLAAMGIPATIFITTASVECGESFWWDVHWRGWRLRGASPSEIMQRREAMKALSSKEISRALAIEFGPNAVKPYGELDRPMTIAEVTELAKVPYIEIGNHTHHHAILSRCNEKTIVQEIETCQERLETWTGRRPQAIAYPNGNFDARVVKAAREAGLQIGVTCEARRTGLPAPVTERLTIGRSAGLKHGRIGFELAVAECRFPKCAPTRAR